MMNDPNLKCDLAIWGVVRCVFIPLFSFISSRGRGCVYRTYHSRWTAALPHTIVHFDQRPVPPKKKWLALAETARAGRGIPQWTGTRGD